MFLQAAIENLLKLQVSKFDIEQDKLKTIFKEVRIKDSTCFQLSENLAESYPGSGGSGSPAAVRVQFEYDLLKGTIIALSISAFNHQDQTDSKETLSDLEQGVLILRDLGYVNNDFLKACIGKGAYFLVRLQHNINVFTLENNQYQPINWEAMYSQMKSGKVSQIQKEVYLYDDKSVKVRIVIILLPDRVYEQRIRKARKEAKKKGRTLSNEYKSKARFNLFITNIAEDVLDIGSLDKLYKLRWQVELVFKVWKSIYEIDKVKKVNKHRFECYLIGKLLLIILNWQIVWGMSPVIYKTKGLIISTYKTFDLLKDWTEKLQNLIHGELKTIKQLLLDLFVVAGHLAYEKKKNSRSVEEILLAIEIK